MKSDKKNRFYVYIYLDPRKSGRYVYGDYLFDYEPFYVGKGFGERSEDHINEAKNILSKGLIINKKNFPNINLCKVNKILKIIKDEKTPIIKILKINISEEESHNLEIKFIQLIGRIDLKKGPLTNLTDGGEGSSNRIFSKEAIEKLRIAQTGKKASIETKRKISATHIGKKQSEATIKKRIKSGKEHYLFGKNLSDETKKKISIKTSGENNPNFGKKHSKETKNKISIKNSGKSMKTKLINLYGEKEGIEKLNVMITRNNKKVSQYSIDGKCISTYKSMSEAGRVLSIPNSNISMCVNGKIKTAGGFIWKYA